MGDPVANVINAVATIEQGQDMHLKIAESLAFKGQGTPPGCQPEHFVPLRIGRFRPVQKARRHQGLAEGHLFTILVFGILALGIWIARAGARVERATKGQKATPSPAQRKWPSDQFGRVSPVIPP